MFACVRVCTCVQYTLYGCGSFVEKSDRACHKCIAEREQPVEEQSGAAQCRALVSQ